MTESLSEWAANEAERARRLHASQGVFEAWHVDEFPGITSTDPQAGFLKLVEVAQKQIVGSAYMEMLCVLVRARLEWKESFDVAGPRGQLGLKDIFDAKTTEPPSIAVVMWILLPKGYLLLVGCT